MGFKKVLIALPATDYTGETVKHTVTKTNLKNQPELAEKGFKEGDVIDIVKPEEETPKPKETPKKDELKDKAPKAAKPQTSEDRAAEIAEKFGVEVVVENTETGEFFTSENLALLSVKGDKKKLKNHNF